MARFICVAVCFFLIAGCSCISTQSSKIEIPPPIPQQTINQDEINDKMTKIQKKYTLQYKPIGYCEKSTEDFLYNNISLYGTKCILRSSSQLDTKKMQVIQVLNNGVLVQIIDKLISDGDIPKGKIAFIKTNKKYVDDDFIQNTIFYYGGTYQYKTVSGNTKTIDKLIEITY